MTHYSNTSNPVDFPKLSMVDRLWGEALDRAASETYTQMSYSQVLKVKQVFAELIVQECAELCDRFQERDVGMQPAECAGAIRQMFGVRE